jgi:Tfp pilus assembly protein PilO
MDKLKQWIAMAAIGVLVVVAAGWFLLISPKHSQAADLRSQTDDRLVANAQLRTKLDMLKAEQKQLPLQEAKLAAVAAKIPDNPALPALVRALTKAADAAGVELVALAPGQPAPVAAAPAAVPAKGVTRPAGAPARPAASAAAGSLQAIGLNVNVVGGYFQVEQFLDGLESLQRAFKVSGFTLAPGTNPVKPAAGQATVDSGRVLNATVTGQVFMALGRTAAPTASTSK